MAMPTQGWCARHLRVRLRRWVGQAGAGEDTPAGTAHPATLTKVLIVPATNALLASMLPVHPVHVGDKFPPLSNRVITKE